jgi:hypothetical protein
MGWVGAVAEKGRERSFLAGGPFVKIEMVLPSFLVLFMGSHYVEPTIPSSQKSSAA